MPTYDFDATLQNYSTSGDPALGISRTYNTEAIKQGQSFNNASGYSNPQVDALFDKGRDGASEAERATHYFSVQEVLARDVPVLTIHQQAQIGVSSVQLRISGKRRTTNGGIRYGWRNDTLGPQNPLSSRNAGRARGRLLVDGPP